MPEAAPTWSGASEKTPVEVFRAPEGQDRVRVPCRDKTGMRVVQVTAVDGEIIESLGRLIPQLSTSAAIPTADRLERLVADGAAQLLIARDPDQEDRIVGTLTLVLFRIPTGMRAWIEDVVVDESGRRRGVGELLCRAAIERARSAGARNVDLTSRPAREAANRLYRRLGFSLRQTNLYRYSLEETESSPSS